MSRRTDTNVWGGSSGAVFANLLRERAVQEGLVIDVDVRPVSSKAAPPGAYLVSVDFTDLEGPLFDVADWVETVRIMDPRDEEVSLARALNYAVLRGKRHSPTRALREC
jgi:hypothetical protein